MKNILSFILLIFIVGCTAEQTHLLPSNQQGELRIAFFSNQRTLVDMSNYGLTISDAAGDVIYAFDKLSDVPETITLGVGNYTASCYSASEMTPVTFTSPYYYGEEMFTIESNKETAVTIECLLKQVILNITFDTSVTADAEDYYAIIETANGSLEVNEATESKVYVEQSAVIITTYIKKKDGTSKQGKQILSSLDEQTEYNVFISFQ
ncbi:DUF4493 domain-containing protein [Flammeovirga kamogawensis]|uniref:DUF4493 domain-containing protein n=1 Tax=Flammeovirga kamogawensis TaxID=373891 RepID=A0ABX8H422_9BACT|nr:DUF4493 domain-containing protein [Flammeovirga kamogawensis]MBB6461730.1 hypothetical protein [Flammeovirga kamogawensis]QWG10648.1 DUF4493 domain-containing protein [Flammeovirga kamogawensis]TRX63752.1 DUF4493 domain-containing protein [Flammeovirga kamogawensis]